MSLSAMFAVVLSAALSAADADQSALETFQTRATLTPPGKIDELVLGQLNRLGIPPANLCSDAVFLRRVYLDVIGTLPTGPEAEEFLQDRDPHKRSLLIDHLLERKEFADYWAMKWSDLLRIKAEFPINLWPNAAQAYHHWVRAALRENMPYDRFVRALLTQSGSNFRDPPVNFYRAMQNKEPPGIAQAVALTFLGVRAERWTAKQRDGLAVFFSQLGYKSTAEWKEEIIFFDPGKAAQAAAGGAPPTAVFPDGTPVRLALDKDPREVFADWLIRPENPWFTRNIVNRVWYWLLGRGIIHEPDDIRPDNPPSNPELLALLARELVAAHYDLKQLFREILNSQTYQLSSIRRSQRPEAAAQFAYYPLRRLEAEVLIDALCQLTGTTEKYTSAIPEPFTFVPDNQRSIALEDGSISSSFLELYGRPSRDTGLESERNNRPTAAQRLHLLNSSHIQRKIERSPKLLELMKTSKTPREIVSRLYLATLSRYPTADELKIVGEYSPAAKGRKWEMLFDLAWALLNSAEFNCRH